jgi:hypothetical protein
MPNNNIILTNLDPDSLKAEYITWLQNQSVFRDYNYSGSNINALLDIFARNTFLYSFFLNMTFAEGYNDSAQLRDSLVSKAKELNYIPYSMKSAETTLNINIQTANLTSFQIPSGTIFTGLNSNGTYSFVTNENYFLTSANGYFAFSNVVIYEGFYKSDLFSVDNTQENQLFTLSSSSIDTSSLSVYLSENGGSTNSVCIQAPNLYGLNGNSYVYFLQAASSNNYQIQFGDGVLGYQPQNGSVVVATYRETNGDAANFISQFTVSTNLSSYNGGRINSISISSNDVSSGGSPAEGIESIRFNNPRHYQTQENAITASNFRNIILENFPSISDVNVYSGGVTSTSVQYGIIFIALVTKNGNPATEALKNTIQTFIQDLDIINYQVVFVDPDILYLNVNTNVHVDFDSSNVSVADYKLFVANNIANFSANNLQKFNTPFRYSQFGDSIDEIDSSILSNETTISMKKYANVIINTNNSLVVNFNNPIANVSSSPFIISGNTYYLTDNSSGYIYISQFISNNSVLKSVGTINYSNGLINISNLNISNFPTNSSSFYLTANPTNKDIYCVGNDILEIDTINGLNIAISNN